MRPWSALGLAPLGTIVIVAVQFAAPTGVRAADITVTTTQDSLDVDGECSLREAVLAANTNAPVDTCPAGEAPDRDTIQLDPDAVYRLSIPGRDEDSGLTGDLDITESLNIRFGTIDAAGLDRALDVHPGAALGLHVSAVSNGDAADGDGGAVRIRHDCAIGQTRRLTISGLVQGNVATNGGAIAASGCANVDLEYATLMDNAATEDGGGVWIDLDALLMVNTATFTANSAGGRGGAVWATPAAFGFDLFASTIADNVAGRGGGIGFEGGARSMDLVDVILASNGGGNCDITESMDGRHSLSDDDSCGNLGPNSMSSVDPMLEPLDVTGRVPSFGLEPGSPAIDSGIELTFESTSDMRGTDRPQDGDGDGVAVWDIGAVEAVPPVPAEPGGGGIPSPSPALPNTAVPVGPIGAPDRTTPVWLLLSSALMALAASRSNVARLCAR